MPFNRKNRSKKLSPGYNKPDCATYYPDRARVVNINMDELFTKPEMSPALLEIARKNPELIHYEMAFLNRLANAD